VRTSAPVPDGLTLLERIEASGFPASLYVEGPSEPLKAAILADARRLWAAGCPESPRASVFRAAESGVEEILSALQSTSLFSPRELIVVLGVEDLGRSEKRVAALAAGIEHSVAGSSVILVESASDTVRKTLEPLRAACALRWTALPPERPALLLWGRRRARRADLTPDPGVLEHLADACEGDALAYFNELDKLCTIGGGPGTEGRVTRADLERMMRPVVGADLPDYLAAVALGRQDLAAQRLGRVLAAGEGEGLVLWALSNMVGGALGGWSRHRDLSMALARRRRPRELAAALDALYRAEAAWKSGRADVVAVLEQATRSVCGAR
jgi:DNA polymerase III delta subunit